jgi:hypothetical protein
MERALVPTNLSPEFITENLLPESNYLPSLSPPGNFQGIRGKHFMIQI